MTKIVGVGDIVYDTLSSSRRGVVVATEKPVNRFVTYIVQREDGTKFRAESVAPYEDLVARSEQTARLHRERLESLKTAREQITGSRWEG